MCAASLCLSSIRLFVSKLFAEALRFYDSVVGEPELLILAGKLWIGGGFKGVLNDRDTNLVPNRNGIELPMQHPCVVVKAEQTAKRSKDRIDVATGNSIVNRGGKESGL